MWRRLKNTFHSFRTYADLSPDVSTRQQVNKFLRDRSALKAEDWFEQLWQPRDVSRQIANFIYAYMPTYSGLEFARVRPNDRLEQDLHFISVCWFDWQFALCDDFLENFGVDLSDRFDPENFTTVEDLVVFLNHQLLSINQS
jgi:hypothetical protein